MNKGKAATLISLVSLIMVVTVGISLSSENTVSGPLTDLYGYLFSSDNLPAHPELRQVGIFDVYEANIRLLLQLLAILISFLAGIVALIASKTERNSFWYAVAIFISTTALIEISYIVAIFYAVLFAVLISRNRKWRMTPA